MWKYNDSNELYHWGILGMKWGHRRYQNRDGTLTSEGKNRRRKKYSDDYKESKRLSKKRLPEMSNEEIRTLNKRKQLESDYKRLNRGKIAKGMAIVGSTAAFTASVITIKNNAPQLIEAGRVAYNTIKKKIL